MWLFSTRERARPKQKDRGVGEIRSHTDTADASIARSEGGAAPRDDATTRRHEAWLRRGRRTSPATGAPLAHAHLVPNHALRETIAASTRIS